jgi:tetratricopeptide (TPR) repeat protein
MKKLFLLLSIVCLSAFAEASFDQIETLIEKQQYSAAASGLEGIITNHPNSAKAYYAMAQAQAGMGNQEKARYALNKARGIDPELKFAPASSIQNLETAITPQVKKIEPVHESDYSWLKWILALGVIGLAIWYHKSEEAKKKKIEEARAALKKEAESDKDHFASTPKTEAPKATPAAPAAPAPTYVAPTYVAPTPSFAPAPTQTVIHHHSSSNDSLLTGMMLNEMMHTHHHDTTRVVEREVIREVPAAPAPKKDSSWDDDSSSSSSSSWFSSSPSKSSSWDTPSSSSSSWGSSSSSSSDSSWGSSDSSSSSSDSSWD